MSNIDRNPATGEIWSWQPPKPKPAEPAPPRARKAEELASRLTTFDGYRGNTDGEAAAHLRALDASHQRLKEALHRLEVSANTVKYCYSNRPENFAAALMSLQDDAESARAALEQAKDLS